MNAAGSSTKVAADPLGKFMQAAATRMKHHDSDIARRIGSALISQHTQTRALVPATAPACEILPDLMAAPQTELMSLLADCSDDLHWRQAGFGKLPAEASQKLAVSELIGPDAMFPGSDIRIGLLIQAGGFHYPKHRHAAEELYLILKGTACWGVDDESPTPRPVGGFVHHKSEQPHMIITADEPLLALWGWVGDVDGASYSI